MDNNKNLTDEEKIEIVAMRILKENKRAFEELGQWSNLTKKRF